MAKRDWTLLQMLAYHYIVFAFFTDREYSESEKGTIGAKLLRFAGGDETKLEYCINTLTECQKWMGEDIENSTSDNDIVNNNLGKISAFLKDKLEDRHHKYIILDLIAIAKADGKFTDKEKGWIELMGNAFGINTEDIISKAMREIENEGDKTSKTGKQIATADQLADSATVISGKMVEVEGDDPFWNEQEFTIKRFKDNSIQVFQEDGTAMSGSVKAFLLSIIKQDELDVEIEKKNTRTIGKKVIEALNSK